MSILPAAKMGSRWKRLHLSNRINHQTINLLYLLYPVSGKLYRELLGLAVSLAVCFLSIAQSPQLKFLHLDTEDGLPDGTVRAITQDKYGYIWLGTQYGLCRYNGYNVSTYFHQKDSGSIPGNFAWSLFTDKEGDVWVGTDRYISRYNYDKENFSTYACPYNAAVNKIAEDGNGRLWLASSGGLLRFDKKAGVFSDYRNDADSTVRKLLAVRINDFNIDREKGLIYLATQTGFRILNYHTGKILEPLINTREDRYGIHSAIISTVVKDKKGDVWIGVGFTNSVLVRWTPATNHIRYYFDFTAGKKDWSENRTLALFLDRDDRLWAGGAVSSLSIYIPERDSFYHYQHDALLRSSVAGNTVLTVFQDRSGMIWAGTQGYGADRFNPDNNLFMNFQPQASVQPSLLHDWGRAAMEDSHGNIWFGTANGISLYNPVSGAYKNYFNDSKNKSLISFNTIRAFVEDKKGYIWIGTGNGLNRFDPRTGRFKIYNEKEGLKNGFVWSLLLTHSGELYIGNTGGLQRYNPVTDQLIEPASDASVNKLLSVNIRNMYEDAQHILWLGVYDGGLMRYDPVTGKTELFRHNDNDSNSLCNNFVTSVIHDKKSILWISTRNGLDSFDPVSGRFSHFTMEDGLPSNKTSGLRVDNTNRLWIATGDGLSMLSADRRSFRNFNSGDGLPTNEFNDQIAASTRDARFIYPSFRGFVMFRPGNVQEQAVETVPVLTSSFSIFNKPYSTGINAEAVKEMDLRHDQNFFSIGLTGLNFEHPEKIRYAYKLEPFDKDWIYSSERTVTYTNVGGGDYVFMYKASTDPSNWDTAVSSVRIHIGTVFYKTIWFRVLVLILLVALIYAIYRYRLRQAGKLHRLQLQATRLEKDKTEIQYQHLINQFNPHFLFNSLTSLNSLIYENRELASRFLEQLSRVYRYLLTHKETQLVSLQVESDFVKNYIALLQTRFEKGLQVQIDIPTEYLQKKIVPVTFQLLIENAVKHNIVDEASPLIIRFSADNDYLYVSNNLQKKEYVEASNRRGLLSLQVLYRYLSAQPMTFKEEEGRFSITIPLI